MEELASRGRLAHFAGEVTGKYRYTCAISVPAYATFSTVNDTLKNAQCNQSVVEVPTAGGVGFLAAQFVLNQPSWSFPPMTAPIDRSEYSNVV